MKSLKKKIVIIEDYQVALQAYITTINATENFSIVGGFTNCEEALKNIKTLNPDFVLMDITLPGMSGIEGTKKIKELLPKTSIIMVSVHENSKHVFDALCAGAIGYVTKSSDHTKLLSALHQANEGGAPMSIKIARMVVESFQEKKFDELTEKENQVLMLLAQGKSYTSIGELLFVSRNTIKYHVRHIYEKLHINSRDEAIELLKNTESFR